MIYFDWLNEWLATWVKPLVKVRTYEKYDSIVRKQIMPKLGGHNVDELSAKILQQFTAELSETYSANTVAGIVAVVKSSLICAQNTGRVAKQFSSCIKNPKAREKEITCFSSSEQRKLEKYILASDRPKLFGITLCLYTGLRIGELLALEWADIDFRRKTLTVTKTCRDSWENGVFTKVIDTPKTEASRRKIPLPAPLIPYLKEMKAKSKSPFVISGAHAELPIRSYQRTFENILQKLGLPHRGFHALRHTFATRALECGMDVKSLSAIMGHKNAAVTLKRYAHALEEHSAVMMNKLGKIFVAGD
jgi:integrase